MFRQFKFTQHCRIKSSEQRFVKQVFETFSSSSKGTARCLTPGMKGNVLKEAKECGDILIGWGDWGKAPNKLKGVAPTPGVGIRKRVGSFFRTITVNEFLTSQTCPCCQGERCLKKAKIGESVSVERHHLLRCTNEHCQSRWWNRNVVGGFNILKRLLEPSSQQAPGNETTRTGRRRRQPLKPRT